MRLCMKKSLLHSALHFQLMGHRVNAYLPHTSIWPSIRNLQPISSAKMVKEAGNQLQTGFVGTPYLLHVLSDYGYAELAYTLLLRKEYPSWLYPVTKGATTDLGTLGRHYGKRRLLECGYELL